MVKGRFYMYVFYDSNGMITSIALANSPIDGYTAPFPGMTELYLEDTEYADVAKSPLMYLIVNGAPVKQTQSVDTPTLAEAQASKTVEIQQSYENTLTAGFSSSATGTSYTYAYGQANQLKLVKLAIDVIAGYVTFPVPIPTVDGTIVNHTQVEYTQFAKDVSTFEWILQNKLHTYIGPTGSIQTATTVDAVNAISW
jgi:hypothetical protein